MKYKVGDKVRIRSDLKVGEIYGDNYDNYYFIENMEQFKGGVVTIAYVNETCYYIKEDSIKLYWTDEMIECKIYDNIDEFWDDFKKEKTIVKIHNSNEFNNFIDYHFKHFDIAYSKPDIKDFDTTRYIIYYTSLPDKWNWIDGDKINNYNVITYDDFIKLVEKEKLKNLEESISNVKQIVESTKSPKIDKWDKNVPAENIDGMGTFENEISNKNPILKEQRIKILKNLTIEDGIELNIKKILQRLLNQSLDTDEYNEYLNIIERLLNIKNK